MIENENGQGICNDELSIDRIINNAGNGNTLFSPSSTYIETNDQDNHFNHNSVRKSEFLNIPHENQKF